MIDSFNKGIKNIKMGFFEWSLSSGICICLVLLIFLGGLYLCMKITCMYGCYYRPTHPGVIGAARTASVFAVPAPMELDTKKSSQGEIDLVCCANIC